jgi:hypothetical protein
LISERPKRMVGINTAAQTPIWDNRSMRHVAVGRNPRVSS